MATVGAYEAKTHLPELLKRAERGETILITRNGKPVAALGPAPAEHTRDVRQVIEEFKAYSRRAGRTLDGLTFREMIEEGRRY